MAVGLVMPSNRWRMAEFFGANRLARLMERAGTAIESGESWFWVGEQKNSPVRKSCFGAQAIVWAVGVLT